MRRALRATALGAMLALLAWGAGLVWFAATLPHPAPEPASETDAVVVLTGGAGRLAEGLKLLGEGRAQKLLVSGVYRGVDVAELLRVARQDPAELECCVVLGYAADNTAGNARETAAWMQREGFRSLRLVTASYHMPRSLLEFRRVLGHAEIVAHPVFPEPFTHVGWWRQRGTAGLIAREYTKYLAALARWPWRGGAEAEP